MKICVYGCGAIGGLLAARLAQTKAIVSVIARGEHLRAIQTQGLTLLEGEQERTAMVVAAEDPASLGPQDIVILAMKSHSVAAVAPKIFSLLHADTSVVTACNGVPWWYFHGLNSELSVPELKTVDPTRLLWNNIGPERALGCVVYPAAQIERPGVVRHIFGEQFSLGEPDGRHSPRVAALGALLKSAGFVPDIQSDIRADIWTKLVANAAFNPVSVMTRKTLGGMIEDDDARRLLGQIMDEVVTVAEAYAVRVAMPPQQLLEATRQLGDHKTSMLHDFEAGRGLELEPIVGAVVELAGLVNVATPKLKMVYRQVKTVGKQ